MSGAWISSWRDRLLARRDRLIASPAFQHWSLANPLTRFAAKRRARDIVDLCAGFVYSQVLFACVRLGLFAILLEAPQTADQLAGLLSLSPDAARRLLDAAISVKLVERRGEGRYGLAPLGAALAGNAAALSLVAHQPLVYADLADPIALLRGEGRAALANYWPYSAGERPAALGAEEVAPYSALMAASQPLVAQEVLDAYAIENHRRLLDVGGGEGVFLRAAGAKAPTLECVLFDLPAVVERARERFGATTPVALHGGDFLRDPLPQDADLVTLIRIVHDHDDSSALALLRNVRNAMEPGGTLLIVEAMSGVKGAEALDAYYGFYTLAMGRGQLRSVEQIYALLHTAGFGSFRLLHNRNTLLTSIVLARPAP